MYLICSYWTGGFWIDFDHKCLIIKFKDAFFILFFFWVFFFFFFFFFWFFCYCEAVFLSLQHTCCVSLCGDLKKKSSVLSFSFLSACIQKAFRNCGLSGRVFEYCIFTGWLSDFSTALLTAIPAKLFTSLKL